MAKTRIRGQRFQSLANNAANTTSDNAVLQEIDTGGARNGTLVVSYGYDSDQIANVEVWTSAMSDFATYGTALAAVPSDGTRQVELTSDADTLASYDSNNAAESGVLSVTGSTISDLGAADRTVVIALKDLSRYVNVQFDGDGTTTDWSVAFIGHDVLSAPYAGIRPSY